MKRDRLVRYLDDLLQIRAMEDSSWNGLQVEGDPEVRRVAVAVDACLETIRAAARKRCQMLLVHHGLYWGQGFRIVGVEKARVAGLLEAGISLYAAHLPLDAHPELGNNPEILRLLGIAEHLPFGRHKGQAIGCWGTLARGEQLAAIARKLDRALGTRSSVHAFGPRTVRRVAVVTGSGGFAVGEAADKGMDLFITGEWDHARYHAARERKLNVIAAGHYKTETVGVKAVGRHLERELGLPWTFLDFPSGM